MTCKNLKERSNSLNEDGISSAEGMYNFTGFLLKVSLMSFSSLAFTMETPNFAKPSLIDLSLSSLTDRTIDSSSPERNAFDISIGAQKKVRKLVNASRIYNTISVEILLCPLWFFRQNSWYFQYYALALPGYDTFSILIPIEKRWSSKCGHLS